MSKYLVIANAYDRPYGAYIYLFGIFDTEEDALNYIFENPIVRFGYDYYTEQPYLFDFFEEYSELGDIDQKEFAKRYIKEYTGTDNPIYLGGYAE